MVKAEIDFSYAIGKDGRFHQDGKITLIKKGQVIPAGIVPRIAHLNPEFIADFDEDKRKDIVDVALEETNTLIKEKVIEPKQPTYTKEQLKDWTKAEQVEALASFGLTGPEIKRLTYEKDRVAKLYQLYKEDL